jgi:putative FmdB family regulatory protein
VPFYEFTCEGCGPFEERRSLDEPREAAACPRCRAEARRVYSVPGVRRTDAGLSRAMDRAEKSAHEPEVVRRPVGSGASGHEHRHRHGRPWALGH